METEIVAKKYERSVLQDVFFICFIGFFIICCIVVVILSMLVEDYVVLVFSIVLLTFFSFGIIAYAFEMFKYRKVPDILITYDKGNFNFANGFSCNVDEVKEITSKHAKGRYSIKLPYGKLIIKLTERQINLNYVDNLDKVVFRLKEYIKANTLESNEK